MPDWCEEFTVDDEESTRALDVASGSTVHAVRTQFGPGTFGLRWGFDAT